MKEEPTVVVRRVIRESALQGALCAGKRSRLLQQYKSIDPAVLAEAAADAGARRRAAEGVVGLLRSLAPHVSDAFQQHELRRLATHIDGLRVLSGKEKVLIEKLQDHGGASVPREDFVALTLLLADHREQQAAIVNAAQSVLVESRVSDLSHGALASRQVVAAAAAAIQAALAIDGPAPSVPQFEITKSMEARVEKTVGEAVSCIEAFAKDF